MFFLFYYCFRVAFLSVVVVVVVVVFHRQTVDSVG